MNISRKKQKERKIINFVMTLTIVPKAIATTLHTNVGIHYVD